jgi:hypothetical protein
MSHFLVFEAKLHNTKQITLQPKVTPVTATPLISTQHGTGKERDDVVIRTRRES